MSESIFNTQIIAIDKNAELHYIDIKEFDKKMVDFINESFVSICRGHKNKTSIEIIKKVAHGYFLGKDERGRNGTTAEFFMHLYLRSINYRQECMFLNMEDASPKKGFDGFYSRDNEEWILDSKSGNARSENVSHSDKISEAYKSLKKQLNGEAKNDPWQNAYQHANSKDVDSKETILSILQSFSDDFVLKKYHSPESFNIIPAATVFLNGDWEDYDVNDIHKKVLKLIPKFSYKKLMIICCTKKSLDLFMDFLGVPKREDSNEQQAKSPVNKRK
ncbi:MAG: hypothetical protein Q8934_10775 [Bacillota bacterium]|nr:hypothetical protein [Bacillota bacterium]